MKEIIQNYISLPDLTNKLLVSLPGMENLNIPPNCFKAHKAKIVEYIPKKKMVSVFPIQDYQTNPTGNLQGGIMTAFIDDTIGPLSYLTASKPVVTLSMNINFLRGAVPGDTIVVIAEITTRGRTTILFTANAYNQIGKLIATATSNNLIIVLPE